MKKRRIAVTVLTISVILLVTSAVVLILNPTVIEKEVYVTHVLKNHKIENDVYIEIKDGSANSEEFTVLFYNLSNEDRRLIIQDKNETGVFYIERLENNEYKRLPLPDLKEFYEMAMILDLKPGEQKEWKMNYKDIYDQSEFTPGIYRYDSKGCAYDGLEFEIK